MRTFIAIGCLIAGACNPEAPRNDDYMYEGADWDCLRKGGLVKDCVQLGPAQRMHGVWYTGFEESGFVPDVRSVPLIRPRVDKGPAGAEYRTLLEIDTKAALQSIGQPEIDPCIRAVAIEFVGRRSTKPGPYYTGEDDHVVVVDWLLSAKMLGKVRTEGMPGYDMECAGPGQAKN